MGTKRKFKAKRSLAALPKGLVHKKGRVSDPGNPFEVTGRSSRGKQKHLVHNKLIAKPKSTKHALESLQRRQTQLRSSIKSTKKANVFVDKRIGQYDSSMSADDRMLARLVKERTRQSQRVSKYRLDDDDNNLLTHKGRKLDPNKSEVIYSDDEDGHGQLEAVDTELHFGGSGMSNRQADPYGGSSNSNLSQVYNQRKTELDDLIARRKVMKAERMQAKETQIETVEKMDESFAELSALLSYRKNEKRPLIAQQTQEEREMNEWNLELKQMMMKPKRKATDRTKTPEEIAKEEAERLHELETRRMARMNGDFDEDGFSDISIDGYRGSKKRKMKKNKRDDQSNRNPDELSDSDDGSDHDEPKAVFTADGLQYLDKEGSAVRKDECDRNDSDDEDDSTNNDGHPLAEGTRVQGNYHAAEQFDNQDAWYYGVIKRAHVDPRGAVTYDVDYDDGDFEEGVSPENVRTIAKSDQEVEKDKEKSERELEEKFKRNKARDKARNEMPFIFEVTTTLDGLHEVIAKYATRGEDASVIIERMYKANSVKLDHRNKEKMQNFYDVLLRRYMSVGDAIFVSGDGGEELGRFSQLDRLLKVMYQMAQDSPDSAGAVWSRRIGFFQGAHAKRLRDAEFEYEDDAADDGLVTAWPSMGTFLLLRALGHIFPVTDKKHYVVTPTVLLLGQMVAHTPVTCSYDLVMGILCSGLLIEYSKDAKRVVPEALAFLAGVMRLFSKNPGFFALPSLEVAKNVPTIKALRDGLSKAKFGDGDVPRLTLTSDFIVDGKLEDLSAAILFAALDLSETYANALEGSFSISVEAEVFSELSESILTLPKRGIPNVLQQKIGSTASKLASMCPLKRKPVCRQRTSTKTESAIKSLAPRMEDPTRYSMSKDKGKKAVQVAIDRTRREYKREHKAISRELRLDAHFIEKERRDEHESRASKARAKRNKNYAWLEGEQASMNEQVRLGGGLLTGGGTGLAKAKAASGKMGIKKGGKLK
ncbi:unnamed protein product [Cylindrotheca closterium]|uniref:Nucleolar protein 14 n=1 Tax=Cylindrotheca closterium TaxID=2856 RepID=A0AAD2G8J2_9STRA|nr:unnamed protein product [Cylindrotheca closterium]